VKFFFSFMFIIVMMFSTHSYAEDVNIDVTKLSKEQLATLAASVDAQKQNIEEKNNQPLVKQANEWAEFGTNIGEGLINAAKELGMAANEFANSKLGTVVISVLIWKFFGKAIVLTLMLFLIPLVFGPIIISSIKNFMIPFTIEEKEYSFLWWKRTKIVHNYILEDSRNESGKDIKSYPGEYKLVVCIAYIIMTILWVTCLCSI